MAETAMRVKLEELQIQSLKRPLTDDEDIREKKKFKAYEELEEDTIVLLLLTGIVKLNCQNFNFKKCLVNTFRKNPNLLLKKYIFKWNETFKQDEYRVFENTVLDALLHHDFISSTLIDVNYNGVEVKALELAEYLSKKYSVQQLFGFLKGLKYEHIYQGSAKYIQERAIFEIEEELVIFFRELVGFNPAPVLIEILQQCFNTPVSYPYSIFQQNKVFAMINNGYFKLIKTLMELYLINYVSPLFIQKLIIYLVDVVRPQELVDNIVTLFNHMLLCIDSGRYRFVNIILINGEELSCTNFFTVFNIYFGGDTELQFEKIKPGAVEFFKRVGDEKRTNWLTYRFNEIMDTICSKLKFSRGGREGYDDPSFLNSYILSEFKLGEQTEGTKLAHLNYMIEMYKYILTRLDELSEPNKVLLGLVPEPVEPVPMTGGNYYLNKYKKYKQNYFNLKNKNL